MHGLAPRYTPSAMTLELRRSISTACRSKTPHGSSGVRLPVGMAAVGRTRDTRVSGPRLGYNDQAFLGGTTMRQIIIAAMLTLVASAPCGAVEFLGVELCKGSVDTSVVLPVGSLLSLESAEIGRYGDLLMLLTAPNGEVLGLIDDLMTTYTGNRGTGSEEKLQWAGNEITAYAQIIKKDYAALAVSTTDDCRAAEPVPIAETAAEEPPVPDAAAPMADETTTPAGVAVATGAAGEAATASAPPPPAAPEPTKIDEFELKGRLKHEAAEDGQVDIMGIVVNNSGSSYSVANFDLSFYDATGELICVDAISVSELKDGQERAFRDSIRCADYAPDVVAAWKLQYAGGS